MGKPDNPRFALMPDDEPTLPPKTRWLAWAIVVFMVLAVLGVLNIGWRVMRSAPAAVAQASPALAAGKALVEGSGCMRCHGFARQYVGPAFQQLADRYRGRADAPEYIARKIREGGAGEWGRAVMPRHPQLTQQQALQMAEWVLSLPPQGAAD